MALVPASSQACCPCFGQEEHAPYGEYGSPQDGQGARDRLPSYGVGKAQADRYSFFPVTPGVLPMLRSRGACSLRKVWLPTRPAGRMEKRSNRSKGVRESPGRQVQFLPCDARRAAHAPVKRNMPLTEEYGSPRDRSAPETGCRQYDSQTGSRNFRKQNQELGRTAHGKVEQPLQRNSGKPHGMWSGNPESICQEKGR